ncbi:TlpA family protein disulfide reductase [Flavobacterium sp.]|uniref:TlpA family protein disulfide reductase n=1 Tax=Flavobacterium sp. TaxID=239 RepID=UPI003F6A288F
MKLKYLFLLLAFQLTFANKTALIEGKILNSTEKEILISGLNFDLTIPLDEEGNFSKAISVNHAGLYSFYANGYRWEIYLKKEANLNISFDQNNLYETILFKGNVANECSYLFKKFKIITDENLNPNKIYTLKEEEFVKAIDQLIASNLELLRNNTSLDNDFKKLEEKNIIFSNQNYYSSYKYSYSYYTKSNVSKAKICESRVIKRDTIKFDFEDFEFSSVFRGFEYGKFNGSFRPKFKKNQASAKQLLTEEMQKINNPVIEDYVLKNLANQTKFYDDNENYILNAIISITKDEDFKQKIISKIENEEKFVNGSPAPYFELNDQNGNKVSLSDFKGKNIYIDFWATWCKPCIAEIPDLKKLEEKFKDKNIVFLSISLDSQKDLEKWKNFIIKKELGGTHLIVENAWQSKIVKEYTVESIPRFIIIDSEGILVEIDAPRPSIGKVSRILNNLENL